MSEHHSLECDCERCDLLHAAYDEGVQDSMLRATQYERTLQDLIADLRSPYYASGAWLVIRLDEAEADLRQIKGGAG